MKQLLVFSDSSKKRIWFFGITVLKMNLIVRFLEESEETKKSNRNYLTFSSGAGTTEAKRLSCGWNEPPSKLEKTTEKEWRVGFALKLQWF